VNSGLIDLDPEEWLLRRIPPNQPLMPKPPGRYRPRSMSFSPHPNNGGVSFSRAATLFLHGLSFRHGCPSLDWAVAAVRVQVLLDAALTVVQTEPYPHHYEAFGLTNKTGSEMKRAQQSIANSALIVAWPRGGISWPPSDQPPT
jgi:hypothetical protein